MTDKDNKITVTGSVCIDKKVNKWYVHLNWREDGKRKQKAIATGLPAKGNKRKAEKIRDELVHEWTIRLNEEQKDKEDPLFEEFMLMWLEDTKRTRATSTTANYRYLINNRITTYSSEKRIRVSELRPLDVNGFLNWLMDEHGDKATTVKRYYVVIRKALDYAVQNGFRSDNPADEIELAKSQRYEAIYLDIESARKLIDAAMGTDLETVVLMALWFGMRRGEIIGTRWEDIDLENKVLYVRQAASSDGKLIFKEPKTETSKRSFPLTDEMVAYFRDKREKQLKRLKHRSINYECKWKDYVCVDQNGHLILPDHATKGVAKLAMKCGIGKLRLHDLRHTNITLLLENGHSMKELQVWAGHSSFKTTADIYSHVRDEKKKEMTDTIQSLLA